MIAISQDLLDDAIGEDTPSFGFVGMIQAETQREFDRFIGVQSKLVWEYDSAQVIALRKRLESTYREMYEDSHQE